MTVSIAQFSELAKEYPYKLELHAHTSPVSPCSDMTPEMLVERYAALGFHGVVITNHFIDFLLKSEDPRQVADTYLRDYYETKALGERCGLRIYLGMEVRFPENSNDYLIYGMDESDVSEVFSHIHGDYPSFYQAFKNDRNVIVQAHPFRNGMVLQNEKFLDGIEVFNMHPGHNSRIGVANQYANAYPNFIKTCGTDFHHEGHQGLGATRMKELPQDSFGIAQVLKSGEYLFDLAGSIVIP